MTIPGCLVIVLLASWLICTFLAWVETVDDDAARRERGRR